MSNSPAAVDIDIYVSSNPKVRDMFTDPAQEVVSFLKANQIVVASKSANSKGEVKRVVLTGGSGVVHAFVDQFLADDAPGKVYTLRYKR